MTHFKVTIVGAGLIGTMLAHELAASPRYQVTLLDLVDDALENARAMAINARLLSYAQPEQLLSLLQDQDLCVSAVPNRSTAQIATIATKANIHFLDFSKPNETVTRSLEELATERSVMLGCGLSPGLVDNLALAFLDETPGASDLTIRVGVLPRFRVDRLGYGVSWNLDSAIDEYLHPARIMRDGVIAATPAMEQHETLTLDGVALEAFTTSGGVSDVDAFRRRGVRNFTFKTLRYPGHLDYMQFLLHDLNLRNRRDMLRSLLGTSLARISEDIVTIYISAKGTTDDGRVVERSLYRRVTADGVQATGSALGQLSSRYAVALIDQLASGTLPPAGFINHTAMSQLGRSCLPPA
ncbi:MAG TPA: saccharopine dehydrogenase C-terminal domain-containing protein [Devosia sp.]|nr:saccharopine dehydrogenase C-terminal domain-containing protein [Devosia sp.]